MQWVRAFVVSFEQKGVGVCELYLNTHRAEARVELELLTDARLRSPRSSSGCTDRRTVAAAPRCWMPRGGSATSPRSRRRSFGRSSSTRRSTSACASRATAARCSWARRRRRSSSPSPNGSVPHELAQDVLLDLMQLLEPTMPSESSSFARSFSSSTVRCSGRVFVASSAFANAAGARASAAGAFANVSRLRKCRLYERVRSSLHTLCVKIISRSIEVDVAESLLPTSAARDRHHTLSLYNSRRYAAHCRRV